MIVIRQRKGKKSTTLGLDINYKGKRWWEPLKLELTGNKIQDKKTLELANQIKAQRTLEIIAGNFNISISNSKDFLEFYKNIIDKYPSIEHRTTTYKHLVNFTIKNKIKTLRFGDVNEELWENFKKYLKDEAKHAPYTIFIEFGSLKTVLNKAIQANIISKNPLAHIKEHKPKTNRTYLTWEELQKLSDTPCAFEVVKNAFLFSCYTGLRISDIETLKKKYFWEDRIVFPAMEKTDDAIVIEYEQSTLDYIPNFKELKPDDLVFNLPAKSTVNISIKGWAAAAGITKNISYHTSRHTFATGLLTYNNGDIATAKELLGHNDIDTTQIYAKIINIKRKQAIKTLPKLRNNMK